MQMQSSRWPWQFYFFCLHFIVLVLIGSFSCFFLIVLLLLLLLHGWNTVLACCVGRCTTLTCSAYLLHNMPAAAPWLVGRQAGTQWGHCGSVLHWHSVTHWLALHYLTLDRKWMKGCDCQAVLGVLTETEWLSCTLPLYSRDMLQHTLHIY